MKLYTTDFISGKEIETIQMVRGMASKIYTRDALPKAEKCLIEEAKELGADAVINVSYTLSETEGSSTVIVSGTAVKFVEDVREKTYRRNGVRLVENHGNGYQNITVK